MNNILLLIQLTIGAITPVEWVLGVIAFVAVLTLLEVLHSTSAAQLKKYQQAITDGNKIQAQLCDSVTTLSEANERLKEANRKLEQALREREREITERLEQIKTLKAALARQEKANNKLNDIIGEQSGMIEGLQRDVNRLKEQQIDLRAQLGHRDS